MLCHSGDKIILILLYIKYVNGSITFDLISISISYITLYHILYDIESIIIQLNWYYFIKYISIIDNMWYVVYVTVIFSKLWTRTLVLLELS